VLQSKTLEVPRTYYKTETVKEVQTITKPRLTLEPQVVSKPTFTLTASMAGGKAGGLFPHFLPTVKAGFEPQQQVRVFLGGPAL
jgi:hypothetical protein